jgi:hypothetical protein
VQSAVQFSHDDFPSVSAGMVGMLHAVTIWK